MKISERGKIDLDKEPKIGVLLQLPYSIHSAAKAEARMHRITLKQFVIESIILNCKSKLEVDDGTI
jgi:hypothetical protein